MINKTHLTGCPVVGWSHLNHPETPRAAAAVVANIGINRSAGHGLDRGWPGGGDCGPSEPGWVCSSCHTQVLRLSRLRVGKKEKGESGHRFVSRVKVKDVEWGFKNGIQFIIAE